jgi:pimeloyl-ACP methyl ester carboxylesterase
LKVDLLGWLVVAAVLLVGVPATMYLAQDSLLFFPQPLVGPPRVARPVEALAFEREEGVKLRGWLVRGAAPRAPLVIYYGGNAEELSWQMTEPWPADWSLALVNYRGYGESDGNPSEAALFGDALAVFDALARRGDVDRDRVVLVGRSLGSGVATYVAAERRVAAVVLISPFDSMTALGQRHYPWLPVGLLLKHPFDSASRAPRIDAPLLAIAAGGDRIIPPSHSRRLVEAWAGPKRFVELPGADHNDLSGAPQFWPAIDGFLREIRG